MAERDSRRVMKENMKNRRVSYLVGALLLLVLSVLVVSCSIIEPPAPPLPQATIFPPAIPHSLEGRADCRMCHEGGIGGAPQFPPDHALRPSDVCLTCHEPEDKTETATRPVHSAETEATEAVETETTGPAATVSGEELYRTRCSVCHGANREGVPGLAPALTPESLSGQTDDELKDAILNGRPGTAMPAFNSLSPEEVDALFELIIRSPVSQ